MSILNPKEEQVIGDEGDVQYQARKYWRPSLTQAEWDRLNTLKAKEVETNLNFIDSETKWLYNVSSGNAIFAVYSTADTENPTVLYASTGEQAKAEVNTLISVLEEYRNADIGTETFGSWVKTHGLQRSPDGIYSYQSVHSGDANSDDGLDVRKSGRKPSAAFTSCLKNIGEQFQHDTISDASSIRRRDARAIMSESRIDESFLKYVPKQFLTQAPVSQTISSAKTSIKQIPALFKHKAVKFGAVNIDIGGGRFDLATDYLASIGTTNLVFDPFNRPEAVNSSTLDYLREGNRADTATCANVLNVIAEEEARKNVILEVAKAIKPDGTAYFMVYEGNGTGVGKK